MNGFKDAFLRVSQLALDTNALFDLADGKDFAATVMEILKEAKATVKVFLDKHPEQAEKAYIVCHCPRPMQLQEKVTALPWFCL